MTNHEAISKDINVAARYLVMFSKGHNLCGQCGADRKLCNAESNENCARQYLFLDSKTEFVCNYSK